MPGAVLGTEDKSRFVRECECLQRGKDRHLAINSFNALSTVLNAGDTTMDKTSMFLPREVPVLVREDRY